MKIRLQYIIITTFMMSFTFGQRDLHYTNYIVQPLLLNPAYAGGSLKSNCTFAFKSFWLQTPSNPTIQTATAQFPIIHKSGGLGFILQSQSGGYWQQLQLSSSFSYRLRLNKGTLGIGTELGVNKLTTDYKKVNMERIDDPYLITNKNINFILNPGLYFQSNTFHSGIAVKNTTQKNRYINIFLGKKIKFSNNEIQFLAFCNTLTNLPTFLEATILYKFQETGWIGSSLKNNQEASILMGLNLKKITNSDFSIGYSNDFSWSKLPNKKFASHEVFVNMTFKKKPTLEEILKGKKAIHPIFF